MNDIDESLVTRIRRVELYPLLMEHLHDEDDLLGFIIKAHLFTELLIDEEIMSEYGRKADALLEIGLNYRKKLQLISKIGHQKDYIIGSLGKLNSLRNKIAHNFSKPITDDEIKDLFIGDSMSILYSNAKANKYKVLLNSYVSFIFTEMFPVDE